MKIETLVDTLTGATLDYRQAMQRGIAIGQRDSDRIRTALEAIVAARDLRPNDPIHTALMACIEAGRTALGK